MFRYLTIEENLYSPDIGEYRSFGICAYQITRAGLEKLFTISDVSVNVDIVSNLAKLCTEEQLEPIHLRNVTYDWICLS